MINDERVGRYLYWSDRGIRTVAEENGVELQGRRRWTLGLSAKLLQATLDSRERVTRNRLGEARRLVRALEGAVIEDLDAPPAMFVRAVGTVYCARFVGWRYARNDAVLFHLQTRSPSGRRVDLCLFGSMDNLREYQNSDSFDHGWTSSAAPAIEELLASRGRENRWLDNDEQARAVEALKIATHQGSTGTDEEHTGRPETRGFTLGHSGESEVFAEVYTDTVLDPRRWLPFPPSDPIAGAHRIIVGRPLWVRAMNPAAVVRYAELRNGPGWARWWWLHRLRRRFQRPLRAARYSSVSGSGHGRDPP